LSPHAKLLHSIADIRIGECLVPILFNELGTSLRPAMTVFPEIFNEDSLLHEYGKRTKDVKELLSSSLLISDEDWPADFR
jgi:hypothetical protein